MMLLNDTIALLWVLPDDADTVAAKGFRFIHVASNSFYLGAGRWVSNIPEATAGANLSRPGRTCNTPLPPSLSVNLSTTTSHPHSSPAPSTHSRTSPPR
ncbi:hypothetical protein EDB89DRAFT_261970 [Lactarius sanguifluus]|nr:hypothetical protein EDB89DRAFT_261970 [Lactarius sanguifluus]